MSFQDIRYKLATYFISYLLHCPFPVVCYRELQLKLLLDTRHPYLLVIIDCLMPLSFCSWREGVIVQNYEAGETKYVVQFSGDFAQCPSSHIFLLFTWLCPFICVLSSYFFWN